MVVASSAPMDAPSNLVLHADADSFFASVVMRSRPELRTVPMAVVAAVFVASANYPARARGVRGAMSTGDALRLCPELVLVDLPTDIEEVSDALFDLFGELAQVVEPGSMEEAFLDVGTHDWHRSRAAADAIRARAAEELGIAVSIGIGRTKLMAKLASRAAKPDGVHAIGEAEEAELRSTLPVDEVWGVGGTTLQRLHAIGVLRLSDLDGIPAADLDKTCGVMMARRLRRIREGTDDATVTPVSARTALSAEGSITGWARADRTVEELVERCVVRVCKRANRAGMVGSGITVTLRAGAGDADVTLKAPSVDPSADAEHWLAIALRLVQDSPAAGVESVRVTLTGTRPVELVPPTLF